MIYDINGNQIGTVYDVNGNTLTQAYDINGNPLIEQGEGTTLTVMTYNIGQWYTGIGSNVPTDKYDSYSSLQKQIFSAVNPDIACLQEYYDPFSSGHTVESVMGDYYDYINHSGSGYAQKATMTKGYPMSGYATTTMTGGQSYTECTIEVDGKTVYIINAHLATSSQEANKVAQAQTLCNHLKTLNSFILFGDFNTVCKSVEDTEYTTIMKQFVDAGFNVANCSAQFGFKDTWTGGSTASGTWYPCDHIITSADISMANVRVNTIKLTDGLSDTIDHIPLIAEVTIS